MSYIHNKTLISKHSPEFFWKNIGLAESRNLRVVGLELELIPFGHLFPLLPPFNFVRNFAIFLRKQERSYKYVSSRNGIQGISLNKSTLYELCALSFERSNELIGRNCIQYISVHSKNNNT